MNRLILGTPRGNQICSI